MNMNKTYKWLRFGLVMLPFAFLALAFLVWLNDSATLTQTSLFEVVYQTCDVFRWEWLAEELTHILNRIGFGLDSYNPVIDIFTYYFAIWFVDAAVMIVTFIPRWVINRFGGDLA